MGLNICTVFEGSLDASTLMQKSQVESNKKIYCLLLKRWLFTLNNIWSEGIYLNTQLIFIHFGCDYQVYF